MNHLLKYSFLLWMMSSNLLWSQKKEEIKPKTLRLSHSQMREGNKNYEKASYADAEVNYRMSLATVPLNEKVIFNMGNAMLQQKRFKEAIREFEQLAKITKNNELKTKAYYNSGNASMGLKEYQKAIDAYKNSLRINPNDEETRYNLALAQKFLKENPPKDNKNKDPKDDPNKDKKDPKDDPNKDPKDNQKEDKKDDPNKDKKGDQNPENKDNKDGENKENEDDKDPKSPPKPQPGKMSDQQMKQLLEAINNEEKKTQDKVNAQKVKAPSSKKEKDW